MLRMADKAQIPTCGNDCGKDASLECFKCRAPFCEECFQTLHTKTAFQNHVPLNLGELQVRTPLPCQAHSKDLELFCQTCQTVRMRL